jgi:hypothetical protein
MCVRTVSPLAIALVVETVAWKFGAAWARKNWFCGRGDEALLDLYFNWKAPGLGAPLDFVRPIANDSP